MVHVDEKDHSDPGMKVPEEQVKNCAKCNKETRNLWVSPTAHNNKVRVDKILPEDLVCLQCWTDEYWERTFKVVKPRDLKGGDGTLGASRRKQLELSK